MPKKMQGLTAAVILCLTLPAFSISWSQDIPTLQQLAERIVKATLAPSKYRVPVAQSISKVDAAGAAQAKRSAEQKTSFDVAYDPAQGASTSHKSDDGSPPKANVYVSMDFSKMLKKLPTWSDVEITRESRNGRDCFRLSGVEGRMRFTLWADAVDYYVTKLDMDVDGKRLSETTIEYRKVDDRHWLPSRMVVYHTTEQTEIVQEYGDYNLISE